VLARALLAPVFRTKTTKQMTQRTATAYTVEHEGQVADIVLDEHPVNGGTMWVRCGWVAVKTWPAVSGGFREFLVNHTDEVTYLADKLGMNNYLDVSATLRLWRNDVLRSRRLGSIDGNKARKLLNEIQGLAGEGPYSLEHEVQYCQNLWQWYDYRPLVTRVIDPAFQSFFDGVYKSFLGVLESELAREGKDI